MSEILSGARYTLGGLLVMTLWSVCMAGAASLWFDQKSEYDASMLRFDVGPGSSQRYEDHKRAAGLE